MAHKTQQKIKKKKKPQTAQVVIPNSQNPEESNTQTHIAHSHHPAKRTQGWYGVPISEINTGQSVPICNVER